MLPKYHQQFHHQQLFSSANPGTIQACTTSPATASLESSLSAAAVAAAAVNYAQQHNSPSPTGSSPQHSGSSASTSPAARTTSSMYPYVSAAAAHHHHQQQQAVAAAAFGATSSMVPTFGSSAASSAALAAAAAVDAATAGDKSCRYTASLTGNVAPTSADPMVNYTLGHHHQNGATPGSLVSSASSASAVSAASASMAAAAQFYHQAAAASAVVDPLTSCQQPTTGQPGISDIPRYPWMSITGESFSLDVVVKDPFSFFFFASFAETITDRVADAYARSRRRVNVYRRENRDAYSLRALQVTLSNFSRSRIRRGMNYDAVKHVSDIHFSQARRFDILNWSLQRTILWSHCQIEFL